MNGFGAKLEIVFPTCVGVDRQEYRNTGTCKSIPHVRGGGPLRFSRSISTLKYSPRAWGWTAFICALAFSLKVFPTCVGVDRWHQRYPECHPGIPHVRGGGPPTVAPIWKCSPYSPRAWGWTAVANRGAGGALVFPTCVGVDRSIRRVPVLISGIPHVRGGGPIYARERVTRTGYSPRAWGWTDNNGFSREPGGVFPTCVGVDRTGKRTNKRGFGIPHVRGGGPKTVHLLIWLGLYSPRAWGWTEPVPLWQLSILVFPTCVGVDRRFRYHLCNPDGIPHVRGGGPSSLNNPMTRPA